MLTHIFQFSIRYDGHPRLASRLASPRGFNKNTNLLRCSKQIVNQPGGGKGPVRRFGSALQTSKRRYHDVVRPQRAQVLLPSG